MVRILGILILVAFVVMLSGCPEEKEVINRLDFSEEMSQAVKGGWFRFPFDFTMTENAGVYSWMQDKGTETLPFTTTLFVIDGIIGQTCPNNPSYCYALITHEGKEDAVGKGEVEQQILSDLKENCWDLTGDILVDGRDLQVVVDAADRPRGKADMSQAPALIQLLKQGNLAVQPRSKAITAWGRIK